MTTVEETVRIAVPVRTAYDQWTRFGMFPRFMPSVKRVEQARPSLMRWTVGLGPLHHSFTTEIVEQQPDTLVQWRSLDGRHRGEVTFHALAPDRAAVTARLQVLRPGFAFLASDALGLLRRLMRAELTHFKEFVENRGREVEGWRGTIRDGRVCPVDTTPPWSSVPRWPVG
ncbi:SRPBCC family protein [Streptomyces sp. XM4193]|uniref:SRPBCC family protein n=1 Tax=Streptomyces sp. XM4193 TaxID=2929782 RepID=UPI001FF7CE62|nr:SRPBCC family protein [Streptomyces sp. XM4193]MCK1799005.1 SRPBCC family protein [Streptomyces sp. XM4193]